MRPSARMALSYAPLAPSSPSPGAAEPYVVDVAALVGDTPPSGLTKLGNDLHYKVRSRLRAVGVRACTPARGVCLRARLQARACALVGGALPG